jgi:hypothetical protein
LTDVFVKEAGVWPGVGTKTDNNIYSDDRQ